MHTFKYDNIISCGYSWGNKTPPPKPLPGPAYAPCKKEEMILY